jgi:hypothetical protein
MNNETTATEQEQEIISTDEEQEQQNAVDGAIFELIESIVSPFKPVEWDIEIIGSIRDALIPVLSRCYGIEQNDLFPD